MSDRIGDISRCYDDAFGVPDYPRSIGLFKIPEYPEFESGGGGGGMWSSALDAIFTALRYIAPATLLTLFWGQQSFLFRILRHIDLAIRSIVFSSDQQKESVLKWLEQAGPVRVEHLDTVWRHGWILCSVLDTAMPGACAGHPPVRMSLRHAQSIADHYLGVDPVFTREELETNDCLSRHQEWKLAHYLDRIREALTKIPLPVSKPNSQRTSPDGSQFTLDYVVRGGGLIAAQVNNKMFFKVYPTTQQSLEPGDITILIKGPKDTYGMIVVPPILGKAQLIRQKMLNLSKDRLYTENKLPITQGATYLRSFGKNDLKKAYFIPKTKYDIEIEVDKRPDHAKIGYVVSLEGKYEISITSRGQFIVGSPFMIAASHNIVGDLANEGFSLEDGEEIDILDQDGDKKVVLRIVDFVTEKLLLQDEAPVDQLSNESQRLIDNKHVTTQTKSIFYDDIKITESADKLKDMINKNKLKKTAIKVRAMTRACKAFQKSLAEAKLKSKNKDVKLKIKQLGIPDVVNSTFSDRECNLCIKTEKHETMLENIPVSIQSVKQHNFLERHDEMAHFFSTSEENASFSSAINDTVLSSSNPFLNKIEEHSINPERVSDLHFTTHNYVDDSDDGEDFPIKIMIDKEDTPTNVSPNTNPFIDPEVIERPKTPVLKIISGEVTDREDSVYIDPDMERITEEILQNNEFINPFFTHKQRQDSQEQVADFIIGAPVSLPPIVKAPTPEPDNMDSIMMTCEQNLYSVEVTTNNMLTSVFSTPMHTKLENSMPSSTFHSVDSNLNTNSTNDLNLIREQSPKRDTWDSAYVSIDETNSSPDNNNNENATFDKLTIEEISLKPEDFSNLGPAEIEMWESCYELNDDTHKTNEDVKTSKWEYKRPIFTPIIEESDRSMSAGLKDLHEQERQPSEQDPVTVAFAELNDVFQEYLSTSEQSSLNAFQDNMSMRSTETNYNVLRSDDCVDSASEHASDVMRQTNTNLEGTISEVHLNVIESFSVSQSLQAKTDDTKDKAKIHFGDDPLTNIVLEKKQFWDEKIRQIEEVKSEQRKTRLSSKHLRHNDSLTKRRGKQLVKSYQVIEEASEKNINKSVDDKRSPEMDEPDITDEMNADGKLVQNWKKYWDHRLEEEEETQMTCFRAKSPKSKDRYHSPSPKLEDIKEDIQIGKSFADIKDNMLPKKEVPEEIMFKAFEESPKRFFGTSRKQILNKIDAFLGKPSPSDEETTTENSGLNHESGIVSSRINLFRGISNAEEMPWQTNKSSSMQNIRIRKDSEGSKSKSFQDEIKELFSNGKVQSYIDLRAEKSYSINKLGIQKRDEQSTANPTAEVKSLIVEIKGKQPESSSSITEIVDSVERTNIVSHTQHKPTEESVIFQKATKVLSLPKQHNLVKKTISQINKQSSMEYKPSKPSGLKKSSVSKSEMDIFTKINTSIDDDDFDKYKSCDELPKFNVKNFISLYETVSKTSPAEPKPKRMLRTNSETSEKLLQSFTSVSEAERKSEVLTNLQQVKDTVDKIDSKYNLEDGAPKAPPRRKRSKTSSQESLDLRHSMQSLDSKHIKKSQIENAEEENTFLSISDIDMEIIDKTPDLITEPTPEVNKDTDYKSRFKMAKLYFQSLEELRPDDKKPKINECEELLLKSKDVLVESNEVPINPNVTDEKLVESKESLESEPPRRKYKKNIKAFSLPSAELSKIWDQMTESEPNKLVKISEKFNVDDLFNDVVEGKLSRQGSLRGIPNKKAVLETFKSMENVSDNKMSPYAIAVDQLTEFAKENKIKNAQTYLTEYPFLPTTDPAKYHSRLDTKASGLVSMKELKDSRPRRNSVPELVLNPKFAVDL